MALGSNGVAVGFFIGLCFMATIVVILTIFYFSTPKPKSRAKKNKTAASSRTKSPSVKQQSVSPKSRPLFGTIRLFAGRKPAGQHPSQTIKEGPVMNGLDISETLVSAKGEVSRLAEDGQKGFSLKRNPLRSIFLRSKRYPELSTPMPSVQKIKHFVAALNTEAREVKPEKNDLPVAPAIHIVNGKPAKGQTDEKPGAKEVKSEASVNPVIPGVQIVREKSGKIETDLKPGDKEAKSEASVNPVIPGVHIVNEKSGVSDVDNKAKAKEGKAETSASPVVPPVQKTNEKSEKSEADIKPKPASSSSDFSGLFTDDDIEESEADRLAKELNEVDTDDILAESLNLMSQFKRNKN
jgi:hypothetical protein